MKTPIRFLVITFLYFLICQQAYSQANVAGLVGHVRVAGYYAGWDATGAAGSFDLRNDFANQPINFFAGGAALQRGTILGTNGFWGIGSAFTPNQLLTVNAGNINLQNFITGVNSNGYMIGNTVTMWIGSQGNLSNIFVGPNAGLFNTTGINNAFLGSGAGMVSSTGSNNTLLGYRAGANNNGASDNTFVGYRAGVTNTTAFSTRNTYTGSESGAFGTGAADNSYFGYRSGYNGTGAACKENTLMGSRAGFNNQGTGQTFVGFEAGFTQNSASVIGNTFVGQQSGFTNLSGGENTFVGYRSGFTNTASTNTFIGFRSGEFNQSGTGNAFLGDFSGNQNTTGAANAFIGSNSGRFNTTGSNNTFTGNSAGRMNTSGNENTSGGTNSGFTNTVGTKNTMFGFNAGYFNIATRNTFVGTNAGFTNSTGSSCTFVGHVAGYSNTNAVRCTFVGDSAGYSNTVGRWNTFTGYACGIENVNGEGNSFYGKHCASNNINGNFNSYYGNHAAENMIDGNANVIVGNNAAYYQQHGDSNAYVGNLAGPSVNVFATVKSNAFVGANAGFYNSTGNYNSFFGFKAGNDPTISVNNSTAIGANTVVTASNKMILGVNYVNVGIGLSGDMVQFGPQNKLEIDAGVAGMNPSPIAAPGTSGLRFRDMHSGNTTVANPGLGVLSVDAAGDVIYVPAGTGIGTCAAPATFGGADGAIDLNNTDNFYFIGNGAGPLFNNVVIGKTCPATIIAKVDVLQNSGATTGSIGLYVENQDLSGAAVGQELIGIKSFIPYQANLMPSGQIAIQGIVSGDKLNIAVDGLANGSVGTVFNIGGRFLATSTTAFTNSGVNATAQDGLTNHGVEGRAFNGTTSTGVSGAAFNATNVNTGIEGVGFGGTDSYGGYFSASGGSATNYAVYSNGDLFINGVGTGSSGVFYVSDSIFKTNIDSITNATNIIDQLKPKEYYLDTVNSYNMRFSSSKQYGLIAQDVEAILPELVESRTKPAEYDSLNNVVFPAVTFKSVNYNAFFALLIRGMQEQQDQIENQNQRIDSLITAMDSCCSSNARIYNPNTTPIANQKDITLSNSESIVLNQNVPNPFAEQTTITYNLPESVQKAQMLFYDATGKLIKAVDITTRGIGQINVFANDLSSGIYSYALVVDGQIADTKRMVKTQ